MPRSRSRSRSRDRSRSREKTRKRTRGSRSRSRSHSRSSSSSDSSNDNEKRHKQKKDKKHKKHKSKSKKHKKEAKKDKKKMKKQLKEAERVLATAKKLEEKTADGTNAGQGLITENDYFAKSAEFRAWLSTHNRFIDELPSDEARHLFKKFVKKWNTGELEDKYYKGISSLDLASSSLTRHKWSFKMTPQERMKVQSIRDTVDTHTKKEVIGHSHGATGAASGSGSDKKVRKGPELPPSRLESIGAGMASSAPRDDELHPRGTDVLAREDRYEQQKRDRKAERKQQMDHLEELAPRPDAGSREAMLEKRRAKAEYTRREKGVGVEMDDVDESMLMGSDSASDFKRMVAARDARRSKGYDAKQAKLDEYKAKEAAKMAAFKKQMGLE